MYEEEIRMRYYLKLLIKNWKWLAIAVLIAGLVTVAATMLRPRMYEANATIAIMRSRTQVEFDTRIRTLSEYELNRVEMESRQEGLLALVEGNEVVRQVLDAVADHLRPGERNALSLRGMVSTDTKGDLIILNARHPDRETAALIANTWAEHYERSVNEIYRGRGEALDVVTEPQLETAVARYEDAQKALEEFTAEDPVPALTREIEARRALLDSYQQSLVSIQVNPINTREAFLKGYYAELQTIETWLSDANALREQVSHASTSKIGDLSNALALLLLRSRVFGGERQSDPERISSSEISSTSGTSSTNSIDEAENEVVPSTLLNINEATTQSGPNITLQIDVASLPPEEIQGADVDALIEVLENRREATQARIDALVTEMNSISSSTSTSAESEILQTIGMLETDIQRLESDVEAYTAQRRELEEERDQTWNTYQVLVAKQVEEEIATDSPSAEVRIADLAAVPTEPVGRGLLLKTILAGSLAFILAMVSIVLTDWWRNDEGAFAPVPVTVLEGHANAAEQPVEEAVHQGSGQTRQLPDTVT